MKSLKEFVKIEEQARVVSAWKYLPWHQRKLLRLRFQAEVIRNTVSFRKLAFHAMFSGILGVITLTTALIVLKAPPSFSAPVLGAFLFTIIVLLTFKPRRITN